MRHVPASSSTRTVTSRGTGTARPTFRISTPRATSRGRLPLSSVAAMQGRKIAEHVWTHRTCAHRHLDYDKAAQAIFTDPEIAEVGVAEAEAFASGRKLRATQVPFASNPVAHQRRCGFVKTFPDPATGVALGGAIVGLPTLPSSLGDRCAATEEQAPGRRASSTRCSSTLRSPSRSPKLRTDRSGHVDRRRRVSSAVISRRRCSRAATPSWASTASHALLPPE